MTRGDLKTSRTGNRTPFQILADYYQTGDTRDRNLWHEYARATRSLAAVRWSRGLRSIVLAPAAAHQHTDEEMASLDVGGELLAVIQLSTWSRMRTAGLELALLVSAEHGGRDAIDGLVYDVHLLCVTDRRPLPTASVGSVLPHE